MSERKPLAPAHGLRKDDTESGQPPRGLSSIPGPPPRPAKKASGSAKLRSVAPVVDDSTMAGAPEVVESPGAEPEVETLDPSAAATSKPRRRRQPAPASSSNTGRSVETTITLPQSVREWLREATAGERSISEVILDALEATAPDLRFLVEAERPSRKKSGGLFPDRAQRQPSEPRITTPLITTAANIAVIDQLQADAGADSRSQLITAALRAYLAPTYGPASPST